MEREKIANPDRAGQRHPVAFALVEGRGYLADGKTIEMWARFDDAGHLWLDFVTVGTTEAKSSYPIGGEGSVVQRVEPILFV